MVKEKKKIEIDVDDLMRACNILDTLRVSLDRIGAIDKQGRDKMLLAMDEFFTPAVYREIADCWFLIATIFEKEIGRDSFLKRSSDKTIKPFGKNASE